LRVANFLSDHDVPFETILHPPAFTATRRAGVLHVPGKVLAKSVLLACPRGYIVAVLASTDLVDLETLGEALGGPVSFAAIAQIAEIFGDCQWGTLVPFGKLYGLPTILDDALDSTSDLVFGAHLHGQAVRMKCGDFERLERPRRLAFARRS
jgi:Ala-tRNA(Pro) deacylase